jgi:hypothetical protein
MSEILQPCPFCGGTKICTEKGINLNYCDNCSAESNIEHWNTRPIEDDLRKRIAELEVEVTKGHELQDSYCDRIAELEAYIDELENPQSIQDACICEDNPQDDRAGLYIDPDCPVHGEAQDA